MLIGKSAVLSYREAKARRYRPPQPPGVAMFQDPTFYYAAIPAVILVGLTKGGMGDALALLGVPILSLERVDLPGSNHFGLKATLGVGGGN